tara:strand:- start:7550 stop:7993 length:444 start_codon:yes stop_codon:yes gene_type:complete
MGAKGCKEYKREDLVMSRSGYTDDWSDSHWPLICWRGAVNSALRGKRGQAFLKELAEAMDEMPEKRLITDELVEGDSFCTLGVIGNKRGIEMKNLDPDDRDRIGKKFDIAPAMVAEIVYENDEYFREETPEQRWTRMRKWVQENIKE